MKFTHAKVGLLATPLVSVPPAIAGIAFGPTHTVTVSLFILSVFLVSLYGFGVVGYSLYQHAT